MAYPEIGEEWDHPQNPAAGGRSRKLHGLAPQGAVPVTSERAKPRACVMLHRTLRHSIPPSHLDFLAWDQRSNLGHVTREKK